MLRQSLRVDILAVTFAEWFLSYWWRSAFGCCLMALRMFRIFLSGDSIYDLSAIADDTNFAAGLALPLYAWIRALVKQIHCKSFPVFLWYSVFDSSFILSTNNCSRCMKFRPSLCPCRKRRSDTVVIVLNLHVQDENQYVQAWLSILSSLRITLLPVIVSCGEHV